MRVNFGVVGRLEAEEFGGGGLVVAVEVAETRLEGRELLSRAIFIELFKIEERGGGNEEVYFPAFHI